MSIYAGLAEALAARREDSWKVGFAEIERVIGVKLPASAFKYPAWWSNNPSNNAMTKIWLRAGWRTEQVDIASRTVVFRRVAALEGAGEAGFGDRPRDFEHAPLETKMMRPPETKMATWEMTMQTAAKDAAAPNVKKKARFADIYGCMKGTIRIMHGVDVTKPVYTDEEWAEIESESDRKWDELFDSAPDEKGAA